jgi:hypothetical protein
MGEKMLKDMMGEKRLGCIDGINTTIYYYEIPTVT